MIYAYTDGAASNNKKGEGIGGVGWVILNDKEEILDYGADHIYNTTNNECELIALIMACEYSNKLLNDFDNIIIYSDSAYCINCYKQKWWEKWENNDWVNSKKQPVQNKELWKRLIPFFKDARFIFKKVAAHQNNYWNNYVDELAVKAKEIKNA